MDRARPHRLRLHQCAVLLHRSAEQWRYYGGTICIVRHEADKPRGCSEGKRHNVMELVPRTGAEPGGQLTDVWNHEGLLSSHNQLPLKFLSDSAESDLAATVYLLQH